MNTWKLRLIVIGLINFIIGIVVFFIRPDERVSEQVIIGYILVSLLITVVGLVWNPKEKTDST